MNRIDALFAQLRAQGRKALMPFLTAGDPRLEDTAPLVREVIKRGAHLVELGIPYSDPIADGPVITASYTRALERGLKLAEILKAVSSMRKEAPELASTPLVTMLSYAIVLRHGPEAYVEEAARAGIDGLIVPDLPVEESSKLGAIAAKHDVKLIQLVSPLTPRDRALRIAESTTGFLYYVSVAGITGERKELPPELAENVAWLKERTTLPVCIGFGISRPEHVRQLAPMADGLIVGSAIVRRVAEAGQQSQSELLRSVGEFVAELAAAMG